MLTSARPVLKVAAALLAFAIIAGILLFTNALVGNPISRILAHRTARRHVVSTYPELNLELTDASYDFKSSNYYVEVKSSSSIDTHFTIWLSAGGQFRRDDYDYRVASKHNTFERIVDEYRQAVRAVVGAADFPYSSYIGYGELAPYYEQKEFGSKYGLQVDELVFDKVYDVMELARTAGHIVLHVEDEAVTVTRAAEILLDVRKIFVSKGINFYAIDFELVKPRGDEKPALDGPRVYVREFLCEDIYEEGLAERVAAADQALREYYAEQDAKYKD